jgi:hypothetical protein
MGPVANSTWNLTGQDTHLSDLSTHRTQWLLSTVSLNLNRWLAEEESAPAWLRAPRERTSFTWRAEALWSEKSAPLTTSLSWSSTASSCPAEASEMASVWRMELMTFVIASAPCCVLVNTSFSVQFSCIAHRHAVRCAVACHAGSEGASYDSQCEGAPRHLRPSCGFNVLWQKRPCTET